jgi:hypothetical protein
MVGQIREGPKSSRQVLLYLGASWQAAWKHVLLPWFESVATRAFENRDPVAVVTPVGSHSAFLRAKLLAHRISLLGVKFLSPPALRELLLHDISAKLPLREHLRLLLSVAAEQSAAENDPAKIDIAKSVARDPDSFLRALDQLGAAGWTFDEIASNALRDIARRFEKIARDCELRFVHEADRAAVASAEKSQPRFAHLLVIGFDGANWPLWPLLRAAVMASSRAIVVLNDPRDEARDLDETWIGTWEQIFGAAEPIAEAEAGPELTIPAIASPRNLTALSSQVFRAGDLPETKSERIERAQNPMDSVYFLIGRDTTQQAKAIVALTAKFLGQETCERIGILFPRGGALPRLVAAFLDVAKIPHNDGVAHLTPSVFDDDAWRTWLELQESPRLKTLLNFLRALPEKIFKKMSIFEVEETLRSAYADVLIDNIDILRKYLTRKNSDAEIVRGLEEIAFLPATATLEQFLAQTREIFAHLGWMQHWSEIERLSRNWTGRVAHSFSLRIYLRWLREILGAPSLSRDEFGAHPYSRVHLLRYTEAENQTWSHLIFAGLNEETWPTIADEPGFIGDQEIDVLNQKILNRRAVKRGRHGEGQWTVHENKTLLLGLTERRQIMLRQFSNLIESATAGIGVTANLYSDLFPSRIANPSELFSRLYFTARGRGVSQQIMQALETETRAWLKNSVVVAGVVDRGYDTGIAQTRVAYDARRRPGRSSEYEFALLKPPGRAIALRVTDWEQALRWPALVWMKTFLGVEAEDENADAWAISTGQWVHRWLAQAARISNGDQFVDLGDAKKIRARILEDARGFRDQVQNLCAACDRPLPDWWMSGWSNALYVADCLAEKLSGLSEWPRMATEFSLGSPAMISLSAKETLRVRGRVDLILARGKKNGSAVGYPDLWVVDYKTGKQRGFNLRELRRNQTPEEKLRKQLVEGRGVQLGLYALAVHALGASRVQMTLLSPNGDLEPQFLLEHVLAQNDFWRELHRMQETGVFGVIGRIFNEFGAVRTYPLATLAIDPDLLREKWETTHPAFATENYYGND